MRRFWAWVRRRRFQKESNRLLHRAGIGAADRYYEQEWRDRDRPV